MPVTGLPVVPFVVVDGPATVAVLVTVAPAVVCVVPAPVVLGRPVVEPVVPWSVVLGSSFTWVDSDEQADANSAADVKVRAVATRPNARSERAPKSNEWDLKRAKEKVWDMTFAWKRRKANPRAQRELEALPVLILTPTCWKDCTLRVSQSSARRDDRESLPTRDQREPGRE